MKLQTALDEYGLLLRRRHRGEEGRRAAAALAALTEYLIDYSGFEESAAVTPRDLYHFLLDYYPSQEEPDPEVALALLDAAAGLALWLVERGERGLAPFVEDEPRLRDDLPRAVAALDAMKEHAARDRLGPGIEATQEEDEEAETATVSTGMDRVAHLDRIRYAEAEEERFTILRADGGRLELQSRTREALGEPPAAPVLLPAAAGERLRAGDIIHAEIAPGPEGWELLEVFGVRPGGYP